MYGIYVKPLVVLLKSLYRQTFRCKLKIAMTNKDQKIFMSTMQKFDLIDQKKSISNNTNMDDINDKSLYVFECVYIGVS